MNIAYIIIGLVLLVVGGDWLLKSAVGISLKLQIPKIVIGLTVVSFATSLPELIVSVKSALDGATGLAVGNVIGSNIANIALVLAITIILSPIKVERSFYKTDWPVMMIASFLLYFFVYDDKTIVFYEGVLLFVLLIVFLVYLLRFQNNVTVEEVSEKEEEMPMYKIVLFLLFGGVGLWAGSELLIEGAKSLATDLGVSDAVIGVTVVSVGTSIPELAASIIAVLKKEKSISLGNLIGSNIFNILAVLGITGMITPIKMLPESYNLIENDIFWMLAISFLLLPMVFIPKKMHLERRDGVVLLIAYITFIYLAIS
ncbi:calcium/sodium antiporter [Tenacibaculum sp. SG-28]|uniref:calcium/sodium antiporter n=1 Tax=Tenacibaculum sp. SG-28 TaxID=754426 RepID=UPI000CF43709|nr:calcium/sodium antiporter [Tenacibaculum sp. SG-28]PQJ22886.1 hypothetical protein BSU00_00880 [Tenacibaculum sp. SG-28]